MSDQTNFIYNVLGVVSHLNAAVQIPIGNLLNLKKLVNDSNISSLLIVVSFENSVQFLSQQKLTGQLSVVSGDLLKKIQSFFTKEDSNNGTVNLFDDNFFIWSLTYDRFQKRLYVLKQNSLEMFDLIKGKWNRVQLKSTLKQKTSHRNSASSSVPKEETVSPKIKSILAANGHLFGEVKSGFQLSPLEIESDGGSAVIEDDVQLTWKELINCYQNSTLLSGGIMKLVD